MIGIVREREARLDVLKAAAIGMVILGHAIRLAYGRATRAPLPLASLFTILSITHVPLFMFISGYLLPKSADMRWLGRRAVRLLVPFFAWGALQWVAWYHVFGPGWLLGIAVWPEDTSALWFLYALALLCAVYALAGGRRPLLVALAVACVILPPLTSMMFVIRYVMLFLPVFVVGLLASDRGFEPGWWTLPVAAILLVIMWPTPGVSLLFANSGWAPSLLAGVQGWAAYPASVLLRLMRVALELALVGSAFCLARNVRRGAWLGALTLGVYCAHILLLPYWAKGQGALGVVAAFVLAGTAATGVTLLLGRWETTSFLLLGSGTLPRWVADGLGRLRSATTRVLP